jgi:lipopolysaccharide transport system permease protein
MVLLFLSPIFYRLDAVPADFRLLVQLNPLTFIVEQTREVLVWHHPPDVPRLAVAMVIGFLVAGMGLAWFQRMRRGFADVL